MTPAWISNANVTVSRMCDVTGGFSPQDCVSISPLFCSWWSYSCRMMNNLSFAQISADICVKRPITWWNINNVRPQSRKWSFLVLTQLKVSSYLSKLIWFCVWLKVVDVAALKERRGWREVDEAAMSRKKMQVEGRDFCSVKKKDQIKDFSFWWLFTLSLRRCLSCLVVAGC